MRYLCRDYEWHKPLRIQTPLAVSVSIRHAVRSGLNVRTYGRTYLRNYYNSIELAWITAPRAKLTVPSAREKIRRILWNLKLQYRIHTIPTLALIPHQINPVHTIFSCFHTVNFNIILPSPPRSSKWSLVFRVTHLNSLTHFLIPLTRYISCVSIVDFIIRVIFVAEYKS